MNNDKDFDRKIAELVRSMEAEIPAAVEERLKMAEGAGRARQKILGRRPVFYLGILSSAAAVLLLFVFLVPLFRGVPESPISEIRTEFELKDKNIKIIFIQRKDFNLFKEEK